MSGRALLDSILLIRMTEEPDPHAQRLLVSLIDSVLCLHCKSNRLYGGGECIFSTGKGCDDLHCLESLLPAHIAGTSIQSRCNLVYT